MEAVDAVVGSRTFAAAFVALWVAGACNGEVGGFHGCLQKGGGTAAAPLREDSSPTVVVLCKLLVGVRPYFCRARLLASKDVGVHGGAVQHQRPLLQFTCSSRSSVNVRSGDTSDTSNSGFSTNKIIDFTSLQN